MSSAIYEFVIDSEGDPSVGIPGDRNRVAVIFHDHAGEEADTRTDLGEYLAELFDGKCVTLQEWDNDRIHDAHQDGRDEEATMRERKED